MAKVKLPDGFTAHDGKACPVDPEQFVETIIRTDEGLGTGGVSRARLHDWSAKAHKDGIGAVVGYRVATRGEESLLDPTERF